VAINTEETRAVTFRGTILIRSKMCINHRTRGRPRLLCCSKSWTIRRTDERRLVSAEKCFMKRTVGYTILDHKDEEIPQITDSINSAESIGKNTLTG
jgi:hypothetical protein